jgi:C-terminal processing protease CtpA/Prc
MPRLRHRIALALAGALLLAACTPQPPAPAPTEAPTAGASEPTAPPEGAPTSAPTVTLEPAAQTDGPVAISGGMSFTADYLLDSLTDHAVALVDLHGFVIRDQEWEVPVDGQVLGPITFDRDAGTAEYALRLPARPAGTPSDVDNDGADDPALQVFNITWQPNLIGMVFNTGDDRTLGWASSFTSTIHDPNSEGEVSGGKLVIWAPDGQQQFPTAFGPDGLLFTGDDPVGPVPAGWSVVDLDQEPFALLREAEQELALYEPASIEAKDFADLPYDEALRRTVEEVRKVYAFNGIPGKEPDWDAVLAELEPRAAQAQADNDPIAFYQVMQDFTFAFRDGHVGLGGNPEAGSAVFAEATAGGYGFAVRELDDGRFLVIFVLEDGPAAQAGMELGAELTAFNGQPIDQAIAAVRPLSGPFSSDIAERYQQARYLLRAPVDTQASVTFVNPGGQPQTAELSSVAERDSFSATSVFRNAPDTLLPVEFRFLESGAGYINISSYSDDLSLTWRLFERALATFEAAQVPGVIIDLRWNGGGFPLGLAGYFSDEPIILGQGEKLNTQSGQFEPSGPVDRVLPNERQFSFGRIAVMVGLACASACEQEAYSFSKLPNAVVVSQYPSSGIFAGVVPDQFRLPDGLTLQVSITRFTNPDGSLFLEGVGVVPTVKVPVDEQTVFAEGDVELQAAEEEIVRQ